MTVTRVFRNSVRYIRDREPVDAGTTNRPIRDLHGNVAAIRAVVESMQVGQAIILRDQTLESALVAGQPVYLDAAQHLAGRTGYANDLGYRCRRVGIRAGLLRRRRRRVQGGQPRRGCGQWQAAVQAGLGAPCI